MGYCWSGVGIGWCCVVGWGVIGGGWDTVGVG